LVTDGPPDAALLKDAASGALGERDTVLAHARRLLANARTAGGLRRFFLESFDQIPRVASLVKDRKRFPLWTPDLARDMSVEAERFIDGVLWNGPGTLEGLFTWRQSMVTGRLAALYGIPTPTSNDPVSVTLPVGRAGLLTLPAVMASMTSDGGTAKEETAPIKRGRFVREQLLCQQLPPPPNDVSPIPPRAAGTARQRLEVHRADPTCAGCHNLMDPLGLAFETFDEIGQYRTDDQKRPIDPSGVLTGVTGTPAISEPRFADALELSALLGRSPEGKGCFVTNAFRYAAGREVTDDDACTLAGIRGGFVSGGGNIAELFAGLAADQIMVHRRTPSAEEARP
jgi:hypothetical protein